MVIMGGGEECNTGLGLGIGISHEDHDIHHYCNLSRKSPPPVQFHMLFPPKHEEDGEEQLEKEKPTKRAKKNTEEEEEEEEEDEELIKDKSGSTRKKLKLTKEQSTFLEDSFREHHTLNLNQKQELADRLNLRPRQVEVWFQNRRARNKLKQTEVDCQMLRKWCESLSSENRRLKKELQELRSAAKLPKVAATTTTTTTTKLTISPSFKRNVSASGGGRPLGNSSMAC